MQDTENYSSGRPYSFNAGGKGIDLLRIRMFSELYGFKLSFTSQRCPYLTESDEAMPGNVELCVHCHTIEDCTKNGGSEFTVISLWQTQKPCPTSGGRGRLNLLQWIGIERSHTCTCLKYSRHSWKNTKT